MNPTNFRHI